MAPVPAALAVVLALVTLAACGDLAEPAPTTAAPGASVAASLAPADFSFAKTKNSGASSLNFLLGLALQAGKAG